MLALSELGLIGIVAVITALAGALCIKWMDHARASAAPHVTEPLSLLFDGGVLHHATTRALAHFAFYPGQNVWDDLRDRLLRQFPDLPETPFGGDAGSLTMFSPRNDAEARLELRWRGKMCWVTVIEQDQTAALQMDPVLTGELEMLRMSCKTTPSAMWQTATDGNVIWENTTYSALKREFGGNPDVPLFPVPKDGEPKRVSLRKPTRDHADWFEVSSMTLRGVAICHAVNINALVDAEVAQRNFVQTLAKTFAHLSIGLAIFDRNGQLALFNPALIELTGLPAPFLSARPTMLSFFDQMRENRQMPEPKNYRNWRQDISELISAATDGTYQETWSLENGRTYSVIGRPHPDGATAFLIEDISAEITLTRNFRTELEMTHSLLDTVPDAMVVFSTSGILTFSNQAFRDLWGQNPETAFADVTIHDCIQNWKSKVQGTAAWSQVEKHITQYPNRKNLTVPLTLKDGRALLCEGQSLTPDATLIRFRMAPAAHTPPRHIELTSTALADPG